MTTLAQLARAGSASEVDTLVALARRAGLPVDRASRAELETRATPADRARLAAAVVQALKMCLSMRSSKAPSPRRQRRPPSDQAAAERWNRRTTVVKAHAAGRHYGPSGRRPRPDRIHFHCSLGLRGPLDYIAIILLCGCRGFYSGANRTTTRALSENGPREIAQVARALNDMRARICSIVESRTLMLAAIGHDLRTPLTRLRLPISKSRRRPPHW